MAKKKKRGRSRASALSPVNKKGIKIGTLLAEAGLGTQIYLSYENHGKSGDWANFGKTLTDVLKPTTPQGSLFWTGIAIAVAGRMFGIRSAGPIQFS
jgi:hypothetical protein